MKRIWNCTNTILSFFLSKFYFIICNQLFYPPFSVPLTMVWLWLWMVISLSSSLPPFCCVRLCSLPPFFACPFVSADEVVDTTDAALEGCKNFRLEFATVEVISYIKKLENLCCWIFCNGISPKNDVVCTMPKSSKFLFLFLLQNFY